MKYVMIIRDPQ